MKCRRCGGWVCVMSARDVRGAIERCEQELAAAKAKAERDPDGERLAVPGSNAFVAGYAVATLERIEGQLARLCETCIGRGKDPAGGSP